LGSGVRKLFKYTRIYSGGNDPQLIEADIFKMVIPTAYPSSGQATGQVLEPEQMARLMSFCKIARKSSEIMDFLGLKHRDYFRTEILKPLIEHGKLLFITDFGESQFSF